MDKYFMWIHYERLHNHNKAKHNKTVCINLGIYCICIYSMAWPSSVMTYVGTAMINFWCSICKESAFEDANTLCPCILNMNTFAINHCHRCQKIYKETVDIQLIDCQCGWNLQLQFARFHVSQLITSVVLNSNTLITFKLKRGTRSISYIYIFH